MPPTWYLGAIVGREVSTFWDCSLQYNSSWPLFRIACSDSGSGKTCLTHTRTLMTQIFYTGLTDNLYTIILSRASDIKPRPWNVGRRVRGLALVLDVHSSPCMWNLGLDWLSSRSILNRMIGLWMGQKGTLISEYTEQSFHIDRQLNVGWLVPNLEAYPLSTASLLFYRGWTIIA